MRSQSFLVIVVLILSSFLLTSCIDFPQEKNAVTAGNNILTQNTLSQKATLGKIDNMNGVLFIPDGNYLNLQFSLEDANKNKLHQSGTLTVVIYDQSNNRTLYTSVFSIDSDKYDSLFDSYTISIPNSQIKKSLDAFGSAKITFADYSGNKISAIGNYVPVPTYTDDELKQLFEDDYKKNETMTNKTLSYGNFQVTILGYGWYNAESFGKVQKKFRIDMTVKQVGADSDYFSPSNVDIIDFNQQENQYESTYGGSLDMFKSMRIGARQTGYILFDDVPPTFTKGNLKFDLGYNSEFEKYTFSFPIETNNST